MLHIHIHFESSLTNAMLDENKNPLFTSSKTFNGGQVKLSSVALDEHAPENQTLVHHIRKLNRENPAMTYRVPMDYDNTVRGIVARLCGEVRRLSLLEEEHPLHTVWSSMNYQMDVDSEHSECYALATPPNELPGSGAGIVPADNPFYNGDPVARAIMGHLSYPLSEQLVQQELVGDWSPKSPFDLVNRLDTLKKEQESLVAKQKGLLGDTYVSPFASYAQWFATQCQTIDWTPETAPNLDYWNVAGSRIALNIMRLDPVSKKQLIDAGFLSRNGNLPGIAMSGGIGNATPKDIYAGAGCNKAFSTRMPYQTDLWFEHNKGKIKFTLGAIKKSGRLHIKIDIPSQEEWLQRIRDCAVGPFQFGKKGLAYVERLYID